MPLILRHDAMPNKPAKDRDSDIGTPPAPEAAASPASLPSEGGSPSKKQKRIHDTVFSSIDKLLSSYSSSARLPREGGAPSKKRKRIHKWGKALPGDGGTGAANNGVGGHDTVFSSIDKLLSSFSPSSCQGTIRDRIGQSNATLRAAEVAEIDRVVRCSDGTLSERQFRHVTLDLLPGQKLGIVLRDLKVHGIPKIRELLPGMPGRDMIPPAHGVGCGIASLKCDGVGHARPRTTDECFAFFGRAQEQERLADGSSEKVQVEMLLIKAKALPHLGHSPLLPRNPWPQPQQQSQQQSQSQQQRRRRQKQQQLKSPPATSGAAIGEVHATPRDVQNKVAATSEVRPALGRVFGTALQTRVAQLRSELANSPSESEFVSVVRQLEAQVAQLRLKACILSYRSSESDMAEREREIRRGDVADEDGVIDMAVAHALTAALRQRDFEAAPFREHELRILGQMVQKGFATAGPSGRLKLPSFRGCKKFEIVMVPVQKKGENIVSRSCRRNRRKAAERWMGHLPSDSRMDMMESYFREHPQEARDMVVRHLGGNLDRFRKKHVGPKKVELPADFVSYDNTPEVGWNKRYGELVRFKEDHGHIRAPNSGALGKWICVQRNRRRELRTPLSAAWEKRIELLDALGFSWEYQTGETRARVKGGDPRTNRAMAAKIVYPHLTFREVLCLGGYTDEELDVVKNKKQMWRTCFASLKDSMKAKLKTYDPAKVRGSTKNIEKLVRILRSDAEDRFEQVFGDQAGLMLGLLTNSEDGIDESSADQIGS